MGTIEALTSAPSFRRLTSLPEDGVLAYWWSRGDETTLRMHDIEADTVTTVSVDGFDPRGHEPLLWTGDHFIVSTRPETFLLDRDGTAEELLLEDEYTLVHDVSPDGRYLFYTHYGEIHAERWPLKLYDRDEDTTLILTDNPQQSGHAGFSPDGQWVAFRENLEDHFHEGRHVVSSSDGERECTFHVGDPGFRCRQYRWHPDDDRLVVADRSSGWYRAGLYDWRADEATWFGPGEGNEFPKAITDDGSELLVRRRREGADVPILYAADGGSERALDLADGVLGTAISHNRDVMLLTWQSSTRPERLLAYDLGTDEVEVLVDTSTAELDDLDLADSEHVTYESTDGTNVNAILYRAKRTASPAVVYVHGGPTTAERRDYDPFAQFLVDEGYTVLKPNYRGSTDQDRAFEEAIRGDVGGGEVDDVAAAGRWLAARPWVDEDRLAAIGHSHGGYNASMLAVRFSELWQLVCVKNGAFAFSADDANPYARRRMVADPERESSEEFERERSALARVDEIQCPMCLIYGERDHLVENAREFVEALEANGWTEGEEFRFETFEDEGHVIDDEERLWNLFADVLDAYV